MQVISDSACEILAKDRKTTMDKNRIERIEYTLNGKKHNIYRFLRNDTFLSKIKGQCCNNQAKLD